MGYHGSGGEKLKVWLVTKCSICSARFIQANKNTTSKGSVRLNITGTGLS